MWALGYSVRNSPYHASVPSASLLPKYKTSWASLRVAALRCQPPLVFQVNCSVCTSVQLQSVPYLDGRVLVVHQNGSVASGLTHEQPPARRSPAWTAVA